VKRSTLCGPVRLVTSRVKSTVQAVTGPAKMLTLLSKRHQRQTTTASISPRSWNGDADRMRLIGARFRMSQLGQSRPSFSAPEQADVHFTPIASQIVLRGERREVPETEIPPLRYAAPSVHTHASLEPSGSWLAPR